MCAGLVARGSLLCLSARWLADVEPDGHVPCGPSQLAQPYVPRPSWHRAPFFAPGARDARPTGVAVARPLPAGCPDPERYRERRQLRCTTDGYSKWRAETVEQDHPARLRHCEGRRLTTTGEVDRRRMSSTCDRRRSLRGVCSGRTDAARTR